MHVCGMESIFTYAHVCFAALQKHYATLQALALDEAEITWKQDTDDTIQPDTAGMMDFKVGQH